MKKAIIAIAVLILIFAAYGGTWFYMHQRLTQEITAFYDSGPDRGVIYLGDKPAVKGFPFAPYIDYEQGLTVGNWAATFPVMRVRGYPLPGMPLHISFPRGATFASSQQPGIAAFERLEITAPIPRHLPASSSQDDLAAWQKADGTLKIKSFYAAIESLEISGSGQLWLDDTLQPVLNANTTASGFAAFINKLVYTGSVKPIAGIAAMTALNGLAVEDKKTGERVVTLILSIQNQTLYIGPLQVARLPEIVWPVRSPPAPHQ